MKSRLVGSLRESLCGADSPFPHPRRSASDSNINKTLRGILFLISAPEWVLCVHWEMQSKDRFRQFGERILLKAAAQDGKLSSSLGGWIREGLISQEDVSFLDNQDVSFWDRKWNKEIQVTRTLRPIPNTSYPQKLILLVETYEPSLGYVRAFALNGAVYYLNEQVLEEVISTDNALRAESGLEELEFPNINTGQ